MAMFPDSTLNLSKEKKGRWRKPICDPLAKRECPRGTSRLAPIGI